MLQAVIRKPARLVVGLMSGTSADGIDAALVRIQGSGLESKVTLVDYKIFPHPKPLHDQILQVAEAREVAVSDLCGLNVLLARRFAEAVMLIIEQQCYKNVDIDLIGSHGQTIRHLPEPWAFMGEMVTATWQIGDPAIIAKLTGITTVGDFRIDDVVLGGQGAPLVPYLDYLLFRSEREHRACLNIGGIGNICHLPMNAAPDEVMAFDTGPGNMLLDAVMQQDFGQPFDKDGAVAAQGHIHEQLLQAWLQEPFIIAHPPKSTGRELYGLDYVRRVREDGAKRGLNPYDVMATLTALTADAVWLAYTNFLAVRGSIAKLLVSGGGSRNPMIMKRLQERFVDVAVVRTDEMGMPSAAKEAVCFAVLANETAHGLPANLPSVTGAKRNAVLGKICLP
jgi:anhydro-N-acetylmuramic acid kinase